MLDRAGIQCTDPDEQKLCYVIAQVLDAATTAHIGHSPCSAPTLKGGVVDPQDGGSGLLAVGAIKRKSIFSSDSFPVFGIHPALLAA